MSKVANQQPSGHWLIIGDATCHDFTIMLADNTLLTILSIPGKFKLITQRMFDSITCITLINCNELQGPGSWSLIPGNG